MGAEAEADIKWTVEVQLDGVPDLVHRFSVHAYEYSKGVPAFFYADAFGKSDIQAVGRGTARMAVTAVCTNFFYHMIFFRAPIHGHQARALKGYPRPLGNVIKTLASDNHALSVTLT